MMYSRRSSEAAQRAAERRERENAAARLSEEVPALESLRLEIEERRSGGLLTGGTYIRRIVVEHAPALFVLPCGDKSCNDGGHELTREIMTALRGGQTRFSGEDTCRGHIGGGGSRCDSIMHYVAVATYRSKLG